MIVEAAGIFANDAAIMFTGGTDVGETWSIGMDNSRNAFKITAGTSLRTSSPMLTFDTSGFLRVPILEITGGSDLAEPFEFSDGEPVEEGSVVSIDPENPGKLRLSNEPYDMRVAGIVSGAGGVRPGLSMNQAGAFPQGRLVALTGRVYCRVDASYGSIRPGDLLTSSPTPGYAMKVTDHEKAQGAILGKAMTGLEQGTGLLLVLVTLQ
jgi:hypothetical protein